MMNINAEFAYRMSSRSYVTRMLIKITDEIHEASQHLYHPKMDIDFLIEGDDDFHQIKQQLEAKGFRVTPLDDSKFVRISWAHAKNTAVKS